MVRWSTCGSRYLVFSDNQISIYSIEGENGPIIAKIKSRARINCGVCLKVRRNDDGGGDVDVVLYGGEDKILRVACVKTGRILINLATRHTLRIKDAAALYLPPSSAHSFSALVSTCSSEGLILVWDLKKILATSSPSSEQPQDATKIMSVEESAHCIVAEYDCKCRVTCLAFGRGDTGEERRRVVEGGRKQEQERLAKLNEMPESDWEQDERLQSELNARKKVSVVVDEDDSIALASASVAAKTLSAAAAGKVTVISREKNPKPVSKKIKKKKAKFQRESNAGNVAAEE